MMALQMLMYNRIVLQKNLKNLWHLIDVHGIKMIVSNITAASKSRYRILIKNFFNGSIVAAIIVCKKLLKDLFIITI